MKIAMRALLDLPLDAYSRDQRETVMRTLYSQMSKMGKKAASAMAPSDWKLVLSLMVKVMRKPTFYKVHLIYTREQARAGANW